MKAFLVWLAGAAIIIATGISVSARAPDAAQGLKPVAAFADIADKTERAIALFNEAGKVILSPR